LALSYVTLTGTLGAAATGGVAVFTPSGWLADTADHILVPPAPQRVTLLAGGVFSVSLLATDNSGLLPAGWTWSVTFAGIEGVAADTFSFLLAYANGTTQDISGLTPVVPSAGMAAFVPVSGGTMTGPLYLASDPAVGLQAATKEYVDAHGGGGFANPMTTLGDLIYENATPAAARLAGDTSNTRKFLRGQSSAGVAQAPAWDTLQAADVPTLNQNTTGTAAGLSSTLGLGSGGTGQTSAQAAMDALAGALTSGSFLRGNGVHVVMSAIQAADLPTGTTSTKGALQLDGTTGDIQPAGPQAAGSTGKAADAGHVHFSSGMFLCPPTSYAPASQTALAVSATTIAAFSSASVNTGSFTAPASGSVLVRVSYIGIASVASMFTAIGLAAHGTVTPIVGVLAETEQSSAGAVLAAVHEYLVTGLTPGTSYNFDLVGACTSGDTFSILAMGQTSTTPTLGTGGRGGPVTMTVQGV
jgi:hypothetical protein